MHRGGQLTNGSIGAKRWASKIQPDLTASKQHLRIYEVNSSIRDLHQNLVLLRRGHVDLVELKRIGAAKLRISATTTCSDERRRTYVRGKLN
jgi:hypothetical protein